jgi:hypothetical protein
MLKRPDGGRIAFRREVVSYYKDMHENRAEISLSVSYNRRKKNQKSKLHQVTAPGVLAGPRQL